MTRTWRMFAGQVERVIEGREFMNFGTPWYVRAYGHVPVEVELTEDPDGQYWGWIEAEDSDGFRKHTDVPIHIQPHEGMFRMQFPYGPQAEVTAGRGEIVRMSCRRVEQ